MRSPRPPDDLRVPWSAPRTGIVGLGARFVTVNRGQELESGITTFDPPSRVDFEVTGRLMDVAGSFTFTASGAGAALAIEFEPHPKRIMKLLFPLLSP